MKKLFKFLLWFVAIIIALVVVAYLTTSVWLKTLVSTMLPQMTKTPVTLQEADVSLFSGKISLKGFSIGNPEGFQKPNAFEVKEVYVKFEPKSLLTSKIIINEIKVDGTKVDAELAKSGNVNLVMLNNNIQDYLGNSAPIGPIVDEKKLSQKNTSKKSGKSVIVKDLKVVNSSLDFAFMTHTMNVGLPDTHQKNIGEKTKKTLPVLIADIFTDLITSSFKAISKAGQESVNVLLDDLAGRSKEASSFVKGLKEEMKNLF